ncbi:MAG: cytochrome b N-terminal domain-containing protein [Gammaproteobacteria bacterium]|nr:cytochrome b N-terminal domain-containing protein [Gammaproteobacteria bacterium]
MTGTKRLARAGFEHLESGFDFVFGARWNPLYFLGALAWFFYWIVAVSGIYLYIFFDSGVHSAYESVEYMTHTQWYAAGIMRSLHRYASDALVVVVLLHVIREYIMDRYKDARWFSWIVGIPMLWLLYASGISGYWVVWDQLAQYVAIATTEWLDTLPLFGEPIARNFLHETVLSGRFFSLMVFIHIAVPLILLFVMWIHIQRHMHPSVNPPKGLALGSLAMMLGLSLAYPAVSQGPANLNQVPSTVGLDWFYLTLYPLLDVYSGEMLWVVVIAATFGLVIMPWFPPRHRAAAAKVDLPNCNGCGRCVADCPYSAITLEPRSDGDYHPKEAVVDAAKCVSCGICAAACPTASPYRRRAALVPGIELPDATIAYLRRASTEAVEHLSGPARVLVYGCQTGVPIEDLQDSAVAAVKIPCLGALPPSFLDFVISRRMVDGVLLVGCREGDCRYRLGQEWTRQRLAQQRDPYLPGRVSRERIAICWAGIGQLGKTAVQLEAFRNRLSGLAGSTGNGNLATASAQAAEHMETHG